jgi:hypothetical protein
VRWDDILLLNAGWKTCPSLYVSNNLKRILKMWPPQQPPVYFWHELFVNCHPCLQLKRQNSSYNTICGIVLKAPPSKLKKLLVLTYDGTLHNINYCFCAVRIYFEGIKTPNKQSLSFILQVTHCSIWNFILFLWIFLKNCPTKMQKKIQKNLFKSPHFYFK